MIKTLLITAMLTVFSNTAEAHSTCYTHAVWNPGYWHINHRNTPYERSNWIEGYWVDKRICPPPPPPTRTYHRSAITVRVPVIFPHMNITTNRSHEGRHGRYLSRGHGHAGSHNASSHRR